MTRLTLKLRVWPTHALDIHTHTHTASWAGLRKGLQRKKNKCLKTMGPGLKANTAPFVTRSRWQQSLSWMASPFQRRDCALRIIRQSATSDTFKGSPPTPSSFVNVCIF